MTVVGSDSDLFVDYDLDRTLKPFCSCDDFHFRVLGGSIPECYHLLAVKEALKSGVLSEIEFKDEEMPSFLKALISDVFRNIS